MDFRLLIKIQGALIVVIGALICVAGLFSVFHGGAYTLHFMWTSLLCVVIGLSLWLFLKDYEQELNNRTGFMVVACSWFVAAILGAIPYYLTGAVPTFVDAFFEATSGFTGTGASVILDLETQDKAILLWRSMTQWMGGLGILIFFLAILPTLGLTSGQLFRAEITGPQKDKLSPRVKETAKKLWWVYTALTAVLAFFLTVFGMSAFDAVNHAMTTVGTGGFSTKNNGIAGFANPLIEYTIALFMLIGSISFALHYRLLVRADKTALFGSELKFYLGVFFLAAIALTMLVWQNETRHLEDAFRAGFFTAACMLSSTGYTNYDYASWGLAAQFLILLLMLMGGMSGSTAGGIKAVRVLTAAKHIIRELRRAVHPSAVLTIKLDKHSLSEQLVGVIWGFLLIYFTCFSLLCFFLLYQGFDLMSAVSVSISMFSNIGPAMGQFGPYGSYAILDASTKVVLSISMVIGRLEFYSILIIFTAMYWRK